jgi:hypothetical protein
MGQKQKKALAKKEIGDVKLDKTSKAGYDRNNIAQVIKRMKEIAKDDTNRFDKMGTTETLERLEQSQRVAATIDAALAAELDRKRALLSAFIARGVAPPKPEHAEETPTLNVSVNTPAAEKDESEMTDEEAREHAKRRLAETQAESRKKLILAKNTRAHNDAMVAALREAGMDVPEGGDATGALS